MSLILNKDASIKYKNVIYKTYFKPILTYAADMNFYQKGDK